MRLPHHSGVGRTEGYLLGSVTEPETGWKEVVVMRVYMTISKDGVDAHRVECEFIDACAVGRGAVAEGYTVTIEPVPVAIEPGQAVTGEVVES